MVFLELRRDSRVTTGNSGCLLCWPREVQSSSRVAEESWGLLSSDCRADRPHLGLCPEAEVPLQGRPGSRGGIPDAPGETGIHLEWKHSTPLCAGVATVNSMELTGWIKGIRSWGLDRARPLFPGPSPPSPVLPPGTRAHMVSPESQSSCEKGEVRHTTSYYIDQSLHTCLMCEDP